MNRRLVWGKATAELPLENSLKKLVPKKKGPYPVTKIHRHTASIKVKHVKNTISIDKVALASKAQSRTEPATQAVSFTNIADQPSVDDEGK